MASVPRSVGAVQAPAPVPSSAAALFIWIVEAREAFEMLDAVARDATLSPKRRKSTLGEAPAAPGGAR